MSFYFSKQNFNAIPDFEYFLLDRGFLYVYKKLERMIYENLELNNENMKIRKIRKGERNRILF